MMNRDPGKWGKSGEGRSFALSRPPLSPTLEGKKATNAPTIQTPIAVETTEV